MADANPLVDDTDDQDIVLQGYQDDLDTKGKIDTATHDMTDNANAALGLTVQELREELSNRAIEDEGNDPGNNEARFNSEDAREEMEGRDMDMGEAGKSSGN